MTCWLCHCPVLSMVNTGVVPGDQILPGFPNSEQCCASRLLPWLLLSCLHSLNFHIPSAWHCFTHHYLFSCGSFLFYHMRSCCLSSETLYRVRTLGSRHVLPSFPGSKHRNEGATASYQLLFNCTPEVHETHSEESGAVLDAHLPEKTLGILERKLLTVRMGIPFFSSCMRAMTSSI